MPVRHLLMCINTKTDKHGHIPDEFQPSYTELARMMGATTRSVIKWAKQAEDEGWILVARPTKRAAQVDKARNRYRLLLPDEGNEPAGHVNEDHMPSERGSHGYVNDVHTSQSPSDHSHSANAASGYAAMVGDDGALDAIEEAVGGFQDTEETTATAMLDRYPVQAIVNTIEKRRLEPWRGWPS